jgi:hypothetical protein
MSYHFFTGTVCGSSRSNYSRSIIGSYIGWNVALKLLVGIFMYECPAFGVDWEERRKLPRPPSRHHLTMMAQSIKKPLSYQKIINLP